MAGPKTKISTPVAPPTGIEASINDMFSVINKVGTYTDFIDYANQYNDLNKIRDNLPQAPRNLSVSPSDVASPYYGSEYQNQLSAAKDYAKGLSESSVEISPKFYEMLQNKVPVLFGDLAPHFNPKTGKVILPSPVELASHKLDLSPKELSVNNYGDIEILRNELAKSIGNMYRDTLEHEIMHSVDDNVKFGPKPPITMGTHDPVEISKNYGYMSQENHLVTGLGKVQREYYALTGKRFESPEEFKSFIFDLAKSGNPEHAISPFSEEARRTLRYQIENAQRIESYSQKMDAYQKQLIRLFPPKIQGNSDLLDKSSKLIPGLVQNARSYDARS